MVTRGYSHIVVSLLNDSSKVNIDLYNILIRIQSFAYSNNLVQPQLRPLRPHQD